jgi:dephospho-CoA kinase
MAMGCSGCCCVLVCCIRDLNDFVLILTLLFSSLDVQLERLMLRDGSAREDAEARLNSQLPITEKAAFADAIIDNTGTRDDLEAHVEQFVNAMEKRAGWTWRLSFLIPPVGILFAAKSLVIRYFTTRHLVLSKNKTK